MKNSVKGFGFLIAAVTYLPKHRHEQHLLARPGAKKTAPAEAVSMIAVNGRLLFHHQLLSALFGLFIEDANQVSTIAIA